MLVVRIGGDWGKMVDNVTLTEENDKPWGKIAHGAGKQGCLTVKANTGGGLI